MKTQTYYAEAITRYRDLMSLARFEAMAAQFAVNDQDPDRARNHALWSARMANKASALMASL